MSDYLLQGDDEARRLMQQAAYLAPHTERALRAAGIGPGASVLDLGCGMGDVALLAAELGASVVTVERDPVTAERAKQRLAGKPIEIVVGDIAELALDQRFDAICGRLILMYLRDPSAVLRSLVQRNLRPGGGVAMVEYSMGTALGMKQPALWHDTLETFCAIIRAAGFHDDLGLRLPRVFLGAGLPMPAIETIVWTGVREQDIAADMLTAVVKHSIGLGEKLGVVRAADLDLPTLPDRLRACTREGDVAIGPLVVSAVARR
jgi:SAM-dependent methyltransferase